MNNKKIIFVIICIIVVLQIMCIKAIMQKKDSKQSISETMKNGGFRKSTIKVEYVENKIADTNELLHNPGKGLVVRSWCNPDYDDAYYEMCSVAYERFEWADVEPVEGKYEWGLIDQYIADAKKRGLKFAFGIVNVTSTSEKEYVTPKWVFDAGAKGRYYTNLSGKKAICPDWNDPIYIEKVNAFIKVFAEKYDGNEDIAYIDIRSFGNYGEQHLYGLEETNYDYISSENFKNNYIKPYLNAFKKTRLVSARNGQKYGDVYKWATNQGMALRCDGILGYSDGREVSEAYGKVPAIFEFGHGVDVYKQRNEWKMDSIIKFINIGKPSYLECTYEAYKESAEDFRKFANMIGYNFRIKSATIPKKINNNSPMNIKLSFLNDGVAYLYENAFLKVGIFDKKGKLVKSTLVKEDPKKWEPKVKKEVSVTIDSEGLSIGEYTIAIGLFANEKDKSPTYKFGSEGNRGDNWYDVGNVSIVK